MTYIKSTVPTSKTHRFFYINGKMEFGFFTDGETDINKILEKFFQEKDFIFMKNIWGEEWSNLKLVKYDIENNEIHLQHQKGKSLTKLEDLQNSNKKEKSVYTVKRNVYNNNKSSDKPKKKKSLI